VLDEAGIGPAVYEAYRGTADGIGGGLSIAANGLNALAVLGAHEVVRRMGVAQIPGADALELASSNSRPRTESSQEASKTV
jgi:hypothetical protein